MAYPGEKLKKIFLITGIAGAVYGGFRYLLPLVVPFLCAYGAAQWLRPSVRYLERRMQFFIFHKHVRIPAGVIGGVELAAVLAVLIGLVYVCGSRLITQAQGFMTALPEWLAELDLWLTGVCRAIEDKLGLKNDGLVVLVRDWIKELTDRIRQSSMPVLMSNSMVLLKKGINGLVIALVFFISTLMLLEEMDDIREKKSRSIFHREFALLGRRLASVCAAWLRTQAILILITSVLCVIGLFFIGNSYAFLLGIGIGVLDALPLFGAGVVLIPWGLLLFLRSAWADGAVILGTYVICYFVRQVLEARIMGDKVGLSPLETLVSMYVGLQLFGLIGFLLGPLGFLIVQDLTELYWEQMH